MVALRGDHLLKFNFMENKSKGLGDSIEKFTKATGIHSLAQASAKLLGKKGCGCGKRRDTLNKKFPYKK
jgi:hypothetical protein